MNCTNCGKLNDVATDSSGSGCTPSAGDLSVCFYCGHLTVFADDLTLREPTDDEIVELAGLPELVDAMSKLPMMRRRYEERKKDQNIR